DVRGRMLRRLRSLHRSPLVVDETIPGGVATASNGTDTGVAVVAAEARRQIPACALLVAVAGVRDGAGHRDARARRPAAGRPGLWPGRLRLDAAARVPDRTGGACDGPRRECHGMAAGPGGMAGDVRVVTLVAVAAAAGIPADLDTAVG